MVRVMVVRPKSRPHLIQYALSAAAILLVLSGLWWLISQGPAWLEREPQAAQKRDAALAPRNAGGANGVAPHASAVPGDELLAPQDSASVNPQSADSPTARGSAPGTDIRGSSGAARTPSEPAAAGNAAISKALRDYAAGQRVEARHELNRLLSISRDRAEQAELRGHLAQIVSETILSGAAAPNDPLVETYTVASGDVLVRVGPKFEVPAEAIMLINGINNARTIRAGQKLRIPRGPFNVRISLAELRLDVYVQDLYVRSFPIGIGRDAGTPTGEWVVKERLSNPTYYPPASASSKRIIPPNDPANPLGEHWIGLRGLNGDSLGRTGYGIHGTIDPQSIGQAVSMGCIRMHNEDVAWLYQLLLPGQSRVTILP